VTEPVEHVYCTVEENGTKFVVLRSHEKGYTHFLKGSGRLNFARPLQPYDASVLNCRSYFLMLRYVLRGPFTLDESGEKYSFVPVDEGWAVAYPGGTMIIDSDKAVLDIVHGVLKIQELVSEQKKKGLIMGDSKEAFACLSEMLREDKYDKEEFDRITQYANASGDERVKDMLRIVQKKFRIDQVKEQETDYQIIE
jgi:hypothetical protein